MAVSGTIASYKYAFKHHEKYFFEAFFKYLATIAAQVATLFM